MTTRREFLSTIPASGAAFAVSGTFLAENMAAVAEPAAPAPGHFHPKGKAPSKFTREILNKARADLPFEDTRDIEEPKKSLLAQLKDLQIEADAGHVAWDMKRFQFLDEQDEFEKFIVEMDNETLTNIAGFQAEKPELTLTINRSYLEQTIIGAKSLGRRSTATLVC